MAKRINKPAVAIMTVAVMAMTIVAGVLVIRAIPSSDPTPMVKRAEAALAEGDYETAISSYRFAFRRSEDPKYLVLAGDAAKQAGDTQRALALWRVAVLHNPRYVEARKRSIALWLDVLELQGWKAASETWATISREAEALLEVKPDDFLGLFARGLCAIKLRVEKPQNEQRGVEDLQKALALRPTDRRVLQVLGSYWQETNQSEKASQLYEDLIKQHPEDPVAYLLWGQLLTERGEADVAIEQLQKAVQYSKGSSEARVALAVAYLRKGDAEQAEKLFRQVIESDPDNFDAYARLTQVMLTLHRPAEALALAKQWLASPPIRKGFEATIYRNRRVTMLDRAANACIGLATVEKDKSKREAWLDEAEGYKEEMVREAGSELPWTYLLAGQIHRLRGQYTEAIKALERADKEFGGNNARVKVNLAELYRMRGELGAARDMLQDTVQRLAPNFAPAYRMLAAVEAALGDLTKAVAYLDRGLALAPDDRDMLALKATLLRQTGQPEAAKEIEARLGKPKTLDEKLQQAARMLAERRTEEAETIYREILASDPANVAALRPLLQLLVMQERQDEANKVFARAQQAAPDDPRVRELAVLFFSGLSPEERDAKLLELIQGEPDDFTRNLQLYFFYVSRKRYQEAQEAADRLEAMRPDDARVIAIQFSLALLRKDWPRGEKYADLAAAKDLDGAKGGFYRARLLLAQRQWQKAQEHLSQALSQFPTNSDGWVLYGQALLRLKQYDSAKQAFDRALKLNPRKGEAYKGLAAVALFQNDKSAYETNLYYALRLLSNDPWVMKRAALLLDERDPARAILHRQKLLERRPNDVENILRLAWLYEKSDKLQEAAKLFDRAAKLVPNDVDVIWEVATFWQRRGEPATAEKILSDLIGRLQGAEQVRARVGLAQLYEMQGRLDKAEEALKVAVQQSEMARPRVELAEFYRKAGKIKEAVRWYRQALKTADTATIDQATIRKRLLEVLLQARMFEEAAKEIEAYHKALPDDPAYRLMRGTQLMLEGRAQQALAELNEFLRERPNSAVGHVRRGLLYGAMNRLPQAIDDLTQAKELSPDGFNYRHRIALAYVYEASGQMDRAITELRSVLESHPEAADVARELVGFYRRAARWSDLDGLLQTYIARYPEDWTWHAMLGELGEVTGDYAKAVAGYQKAAELSGFAPQVLDRLLRIHIAFGRYDRVISFVEKRLPPEKRNVLAQTRVAEAYFKKGDKAKGKALYEEVLAAVSRNLPLSLRVIRSVGATLGTDEALAMLQQRAAAEPANLVVKYMLVALLAEQQKFDEADKVSAELVGLARNQQEKALFLRQRGALLYRAGRHAEAAKAYEDLLKVVPEDAEALNNIAYILAEDLKRPAEAVPYAKRAAALRPKDANVLDTLGWTYFLVGDLDKALGTLLEALQVSTTNVAARYHIAMIYEKRGQKQQALAELRQALQTALAAPKGSIERDFVDRIKKRMSELTKAAAESPAR